MILSKENYKEYIPEDEQDYVLQLLKDVENINEDLAICDMQNRQLVIDFNEKHTEYSVERTDPCPDYYGTYSLRFKYLPEESLCLEMNIGELDTVICAISSFIIYAPNKKDCNYAE